MKQRMLPTLAAAASLALLASLTLALLAAPLCASPAAADVLWDQSSIDEFGPGYFNSLSGLPPFGTTMYAVGDVTVGPGGWIVDSISQMYSALDPEWGLAIETGRLIVIPKTAALPLETDNPATGAMVAMTGVQVENHFVVTASGLNLVLAPGDYWIGITPVAPSGPWGPELHLSTPVHQGDDSPWFDPYAFFGPAGWSVPAAGYDATLLVTGVIQDPTPAARKTWGGIKALYR